MRTPHLALASLLALAACGRRAPPPAHDAGAGVRLHVESAPGVPVVDIRDVRDGSATNIRIGGAQVAIPTGEQALPDVP